MTDCRVSSSTLHAPAVINVPIKQQTTIDVVFSHMKLVTQSSCLHWFNPTSMFLMAIDKTSVCFRPIKYPYVKHETGYIIAGLVMAKNSVFGVIFKTESPETVTVILLHHTQDTQRAYQEIFPVVIQSIKRNFDIECPDIPNIVYKSGILCLAVQDPLCSVYAALYCLLFDCVPVESISWSVQLYIEARVLRYLFATFCLQLPFPQNEP